MENRTIKILAIDDNQDNLVTIKALLRDLFPEARMLMATSGAKGLEIAASEKPDVILLDVIMPGMDGFEVCRKLKTDAALCDIPVVFVTAIKGDKESRIRALESGAEAFLSKPIDETELTAQIRAMLKINTANLEKRNEKERLSALVEERTREIQEKNVLTINLLEDLRIENENRKKTESELRLSKEKFSKSFYTSPDSIIINRLDDGKIVEVNDGFKKIMGYEENEVIGKTTIELNFYVNPEERNAIIHELKTKGQAKDIECWFANKNGKPILGLLSAVVIDINGIIHILSTTRDITERKQAEAKIKESEEKYRTIFENVQDVFYQTDLAGTVVEMSPSIYYLCEYKREELIGCKVSVLYNKPDERGLLVDAILRNGELWDYELELKTKTGEIKIVSINARLIKDRDGKPTHIDGAIRDITERKQAEEEAMKIGLHYQAIIEKAPDGIVLINAEGNFKFVSPAAKKMFGYELSEEPAGNPSQFTHPDDLQQVLTELANIIQDPTYTTTLQYRYMDKNSNWRWVESTFSNLLADPNVEAIVINFRDINDRKLAEAELKESEEFSRYLLQTIPFGMNIVDEKGTILFQSDNLKKLCEEQANENTCWELYRDDKKQCTDCPLNIGIRLGVTDVYESTGVLGGKTFEITHTGIIHKGRKAMLEIFVDITGRKQAEQELIKAKEHAENNNRINEARLKLLQFSESHTIDEILEETLNMAEIISHSQIGFFHFVEQDQTNLLLQNWSTGTKKYYCNALGKGSHYPIDKAGVWVDCVSERKPVIHNNYEALKHKKGLPEGHATLIRELVVPIIYDDVVKAIFGIGNKKTEYNQIDVENISLLAYLAWEMVEKKKISIELVFAKENAEASEAYFRSIFENSPVGKSITSMDGSIKTNKAFSDMLGYNFDEFQTKKWSEITHPDDIQKSSDAIEALLTGDEAVRRFEKRYIHKNGSIIFADIITTLQRSDTGKPLFFLASIIDITERKKTELLIQQNNEELLKARDHAEESDRLKSAFLANMSHEIRTPMNGILGFAELLKMPGLTGEQQQEYIEIIKKSGDRMLNIINNIVDISKIESGQMTLNVTETNINESLEFIYNFFEPEVKSKGIELLVTHKLPVEQAVVETDREKIYAILTNLVKNAIKFSDTGTIRIGSHLKGKFLEFFVTDKGIGIPYARQQAIFERFIQADISDKRAFQGAGLGLSISKAYAEMLDGKIWVESLEGEGSTFYFTIPYKPKKELNAGVWYVDPAELNLKKDLKLKVLVVEDDEISQRLVNLAVGKISKEILSVNSGIDAVEVCRKTPDIDLILMDIKMPVMDGYETTQQIRRFNKETVIIAQTAFGLSGDKEKALAAGCNGYISKPLNIAMLTKLIQAHFNVF